MSVPLEPLHQDVETIRSASGSQAVYIIDGARTPFLKARGVPGPFTPVDLAVQCGRPLLMRQDFSPDAIDRVILGCVNVIADEMNPARIAALRLGLPPHTPAFTVQINCGSGMLSIDSGFRRIRDGESDLVLAGGTESLSHTPLVFIREAAEWFAKMSKARGPVEQAELLTELRARFFSPVVGLERGLTDPVVELNMGQTAEVLAHLFGIDRKQADAYALESHQRLVRAQKEGTLASEITPLFAEDGNVYENDDGVRPDTSAEKLAGLDPVFEPPWGQVTAGNSSQVTDGASWVILASEDAVDKYGLTPKAVIRDSTWAALDPSIMGLGPVLASTELMKRHALDFNGVELWEINEAFAAQVLACLEAWKDDTFCRDVLGLDQAMGEMPPDRLNYDGGAIGLGHPVGTSGNRIVLHLTNAMQRLGLKTGIASECIGGGQGGAMLIETV